MIYNMLQTPRLAVDDSAYIKPLLHYADHTIGSLSQFKKNLYLHALPCDRCSDERS